jgi:hypothetical protein
MGPCGRSLGHWGELSKGIVGRQPCPLPLFCPGSRFKQLCSITHSCHCHLTWPAEAQSHASAWSWLGPPNPRAKIISFSLCINYVRCFIIVAGSQWIQMYRSKEKSKRIPKENSVWQKCKVKDKGQTRRGHNCHLREAQAQFPECLHSYALTSNHQQRHRMWTVIPTKGNACSSHTCEQLWSTHN